MADDSPHGWRRHPRILGLGGLAVAALAVGIAVWSATASGVSGYRTAQATTATVRQTLGVAGTVEPVNQATAALPGGRHRLSRERVARAERHRW